MIIKAIIKMKLSDKDSYVRKYKLEYILQGINVDDLTEQQLLREEVINRIMEFRGRARIDHEKKLKMQRKSMITSFDESLKARCQVRRASLTRELVDNVTKSLADAVVQGRRDLCNDFNFLKVADGWRAKVQQEASVYYEKKKHAIVQSMREEVRKTDLNTQNYKSFDTVQTEEGDQGLQAFLGHDLLRRELESRIDNALASDLEPLLSRVPLKAQRAVGEVLELQHRNLQLSAKIAIMKSILKD